MDELIKERVGIRAFIQMTKNIEREGQGKALCG